MINKWRDKFLQNYTTETLMKEIKQIKLQKNLLYIDKKLSEVVRGKWKSK